MDKILSAMPPDLQDESTKMNILFICDAPDWLRENTASMLFDYISAFQIFSRHEIYVLSNRGELPDWVDIDRFDAVVVHWSIYLLGEDFISQSALEILRNFDGLKISFIQDEYRQINKIREKLRFVGFDLLFTCMPDSCVDIVYPREELPGLERVQVLTGYIPGSLCYRVTPKIVERELDVFYRGRQVPYWLGSVAQEKHDIGLEFEKRAAEAELITDIKTGELDRVYGVEWIERLTNAKATLGVESAASLLDFDGSIQQKVEEFTTQNPSASFSECEANCFSGLDGKWGTHQISPRIFEAIALRTPLVLYEGSYSGVIEPYRHYIPLKKDFSNFDEVCRALKSNEYLQAIADRAFHDVALNEKYSYRSLVRIFDEAITARVKEQNRLRNFQPYAFSEFLTMVNGSNAKSEEVLAVEEETDYEDGQVADSIAMEKFTASGEFGTDDENMPTKLHGNLQPMDHAEFSAALKEHENTNKIARIRFFRNLLFRYGAPVRGVTPEFIRKIFRPLVKKIIGE